MVSIIICWALAIYNVGKGFVEIWRSSLYIATGQFFIVLSLRHIIFMTQRFCVFFDWFDSIGRRVIDFACVSLRTVFTESAPRPLLMCEAPAPELFFVISSLQQSATVPLHCGDGSSSPYYQV